MTSNHPLNRARLAVAVGAACLAAACGGGGGTGAGAAASGSGTSASPAGGVAASFPTGLSVAAPTAMSAAAHATVAVRPLQRLADFARSTYRALALMDGDALLQLTGSLAPVRKAHAASAATPELRMEAERIVKVLAGDAVAPLAAVLDFQRLFQVAGNASCYGPPVRYAQHEDAPPGEPASGRLPGGDLGLWQALAGGGTPCVAAQLETRTDAVKGRVRHGLLMAALMRRAVATNGVTLPEAGQGLDLTDELHTALGAVSGFGARVEAATLSRSTDGRTYTYRLVLTAGTGAETKTGEVILRHVPGADGSAYTGVLQVAGFALGSDAAFGCSDQVDAASGRFKTARVATVKYERDGDEVRFGSRESVYCGHGSVGSAHLAAEVASFTGDGQLDPAVRVSGDVRGATLGWRGDFTRFAGRYHKETAAGDFLYAWQAGTGDSHARALAMHAEYNSATETRSVDGYFAFTDEIAASDGSLKGMICNWAGPGNRHVPVARFQSQTATLSAAATGWSVPAGSSRITYAPTRSCNSTATTFDADLSGAIAGGEGTGTTHNLDRPTLGRTTVQAEVASRGFRIPTLF